MKNIKIIISLFSLIILFSCNNNSKPLDNQTSGSIAVSVDETYKPIMEEQIKIFEARYPKAKINAVYKPESNCIDDFLKDTTRLIFITRTLNENEKNICNQKKIAITRELPLVRDAIAFIVSKNTKSDFTQTEIVNILKGDNIHQIVFDNQNSSTLRFVQDSILKNNTLNKNTFAAKGSADIIKHIAENNNAIGIIGSNWLADTTNEITKQFLKSINVVGILPYNDSLIRYRKPILSYIANQEYPYCRQLYFISKEAYVGLGTGFANYLGKDGQLVFGKNNMFALQQNTNIKSIRIAK